jgi:hypothetical protein
MHAPVQSVGQRFIEALLQETAARAEHRLGIAKELGSPLAGEQ